MISLRNTLLAGTLLVAQAGAAAAQGDAAVGEELAAEWCAKCHDISADGPFKLIPPSFAAIATYRAPDDIRWRIQFPPVHASMPRLGLLLDVGALDDLIAYILSLDPAGQP